MSAHSPRSRSRRPHRDVDLEACVCVDVGHHWRHMEFTSTGYRQRGALRGVAERILYCVICSSSQGVALNSWGRPISRHYQWDETYIRNARLLGDLPWERRANYRVELMARAREAERVVRDADAET